MMVRSFYQVASQGNAVKKKQQQKNEKSHFSNGTQQKRETNRTVTEMQQVIGHRYNFKADI